MPTKRLLKNKGHVNEEADLITTLSELKKGTVLNDSATFAQGSS